ncbi:hypothetical protein BN175_1660017 [Clostridioides difficile T23]|nr:hypothetical protein BN175_1660017 [Clostridioides difficile T23]
MSKYHKIIPNKYIDITPVIIEIPIDLNLYATRSTIIKDIILGLAIDKYRLSPLKNTSLAVKEVSIATGINFMIFFKKLGISFFEKINIGSTLGRYVTMYIPIIIKNI